MTVFLAVLAPAFGGVTIDVTEVGSNVEVTASGTLDLSGLNLAYTNLTPNSWNVYPQSAALRAGAFTSYDLYSGIESAGGQFGTGTFASATSSAGDLIYVSAGYIGVPYNFVTGSNLGGSNTFAGQSFASLGLTPGTYVWSWSGDAITLNIGAAAVPEPSLSALIVGLGVVGMVLLRRRHVARSN